EFHERKLGRCYLAPRIFIVRKERKAGRATQEYLLPRRQYRHYNVRRKYGRSFADPSVLDDRRVARTPELNGGVMPAARIQETKQKQGGTCIGVIGCKYLVCQLLRGSVRHDCRFDVEKVEHGSPCADVIAELLVCVRVEFALRRVHRFATFVQDVSEGVGTG